MTLLLARAFTRLVAIAAVVLLAVAGLAAAIFCIEGGNGTLSLVNLSAELGLPQLGHDVGRFLGRLEAHGPDAVVAAIVGGGAALLGLAMLAATFVPRRERLILLEQRADGAIYARRRAVAQAAVALAEPLDAVLGVRARAKPWRRSIGGRVRMRIERAADAGDRGTREQVSMALAPLTSSLPVRADVRSRARQVRSAERARRSV
ncbi:MAG: hypothetical protein ACYCSI_16250 [Solirubrobacteraceae bacterium]